MWLLKLFVNTSFLLILLISISAIFGVSNPVLAIENPDSISINSLRIFTDVLDTGDQLVIVEYEVMYDLTPEESASDAFYFGVYAEGSLLKARSIAYYNHYFSVMYLTEDSSLDINIPYSFRISGNPIYFEELTEGVNQSSWGLGPADWLSGSYLCEYIKDFVSILEDSWGIPLVDEFGKLNGAGTQVFEGELPGLRVVCSEMYAYSVTYPAAPGEPPTGESAHQETLYERIPERLEAAFEGIGEWLGFPGQVVGGIIVMCGFFLVLGRVYFATHSQVGSVLISLPFAMLMFAIGVIPLVVFFTFVAIIVFLAGVVFILGRFA